MTVANLGPAAASRSLRAVVLPYAGVPPKAVELLAAPELASIPVCLYNVHHNAAPTAELAVGLMLAASRRLCAADAALRRGDWQMRGMIAEMGGL